MAGADKFNGFVFDGPKIDDIDLPRVGHEIGVGEDIIHGVMDVEAAGKSTDSKGRLKALYEPHVAYRNSRGAVREKLVKAGLAYPKWGEKSYPRDSYPNILKAMAIDETVALLATSWGFPQILGENFALAGYDTVQDMVLDFLKDEDNQLEAMIRFVKAAGLDDELRVLEAKLKRGQRITADDARPFVRGYNGSGYAKNDYHTKLAAAINKWAKIPDTPWTPDDSPIVVEVPADIYDGKFHKEVEAVQVRLDELGYPEVGATDGKWGTKTRAAILAFRADKGLPLNPVIDAGLLAALMTAEKREIAPARANATVADLRAEGAKDVAAADQTQIVGTVATGIGGISIVGKLTEQFESYGGLIKTAADAIAPVQDFLANNLWVLLLAGGAFVVWKSGVLKNIRLTKHQTGNDVSL